MTTTPLIHRDELLKIIRDVRSRWRWKVVLRSLTVLVGAAIATLLVAAYGLEQFRFSPASIIGFRVLVYLAFVALGWFFFVRPLARRVTDQQVALYLEEHEPSLQEALLSAVDASAADRPVAAGRDSVHLLKRLIESAIERCRQTDLGRDVERQSLRRSAVALAAIGVATALVFIVGPAYLRQGALAVLVPAGGVEAASPYRLEVTPGDATVSRGSDVSITAKIVGFTSADVDLFTRTSAGAPFERAAMVAGADSGLFEITLFGVRESTEYFVQSAGVRSEVFDLDVADLPFVERLELEYVFPAYTGVPPKTVEDGGDVAALRGTTVRLRVHPTLSSASGRIVLGETGHAELTSAEDGTLTGSFVVSEDGFYRIDLASAAGTLVKASPQYTIDVLADEPPAVTFSKPGRDLRATNIDEIFVEAKADDDFGVRQLDLVYSVNGGSERPVRLVAPQGKPLAQVTAGHTFFLEEMGLKPGDVVSYYARAVDNDTVKGAKTSTSDIFFLQIQPFRKDYRAAESQAGGGQEGQGGAGGGGGSEASALSEQQRRIVTGTFNVVRDREKATAEKFREDVVFLALAQGQLRDRARELAGQINVRVGDIDATMKQIAGELGQAVAAMGAAEKKLQARDPKGALPPEQQALASLQRAEEAYRDVRIRMEQQRGGGGGGGGASGAAEELADLFQLELDKLRSQYETFQRSEQQSADNQMDAMLERLRELARRQEQEAERQRQLAGNRQASGGSGASGARQRQLADDTEEAARQLERLSREQGRQDLADAARGLRDAADAMRRAAASGDAGAFNSAREAADRLRQTSSRLDQQRTDRLARDIENALSQVRKLAEEQDSVQADVRRLDQAGPTRNAQVQRLLERKDLEAKSVEGIERELDRTASDFRRERQEAARKVQEAADTIRDTRLKEKIQYSKGVVQGAPPAQAAEFEAQIGSDIANLESRLREAAAAAGTVERDRRAEALERARNLVRGMESLEQRAREQQAQARAGQGAPGEGREAGAGERGQAGRGQSGREQGAAGQQGDRAGGGGQGQDRSGAQAQNRAGAGGQGQDRAGGQGQTRGGAGGQGQDRTGDDQRGDRQLAGPAGGATTAGSADAHPQDPRQLQREVQERRAEAQALRRELQAMGVDVSTLDALIRDLRAFDGSRAYGDLEEVLSLRAELVEGFRRFEFDLRRALGDSRAEQLLLSGSDEVPPEYRKLIEEYYRALAREKKK